MPKLTSWVAVMAVICGGCMGGRGGGGGAGGVELACEVSGYCVMVSEFECADRGGDVDFDDSCSSLGYSCEDGDRRYEADDPDCPDNDRSNSNPDDSAPDDSSNQQPDQAGACTTSTSGGSICGITTESDCAGTYLGGSCSDSTYPWECDGDQYDTPSACLNDCPFACDYLGNESDLDEGTCIESSLGTTACSDVLPTDCRGTFEQGSTCLDDGFVWVCSDGLRFEQEFDCLLGCLGGSCTQSGGSTNPTDPDPDEDLYDGIPAGGGVIAVDVTARAEKTLDFEIDVFVIDDSGDLIDNLGETDIYFNDATFDFPDGDDPYFTFTQTCFDAMTTPEHGPYSAVMLMDQSGSISSTDPGDTRIEAAKIFFDALGPSDEAILAAFSSGGSLGSDFVSWGDFGVPANYDATIDMLTSLEGGGTPLYDATVVYTDKVVAEGNNENKAVIIFTDGDDTASSETLSSAVANANDQGVTLFTVGLSDGVDRGVLQQLAFQTGGSMMYTDDAADLVSLYGTLGNLLSGGVSYYHTCWTVERDLNDFLGTGGHFSTSLLVTRSTGGYATVPVYVGY